MSTHSFFDDQVSGTYAFRKILLSLVYAILCGLTRMLFDTDFLKLGVTEPTSVGSSVYFILLCLLSDLSDDDVSIIKKFKTVKYVKYGDANVDD